MKKIFYIILCLLPVLSFAQDILDDEREPIVVETKADLQSELELAPIKYLRDIKPDSLIKFNYAYHGRPLKSDFFLFPEKKLKAYLNLSSGNKDILDIRSYFSLNKFNQRLDYSIRHDSGDRSKEILSIANNFTTSNHQISLSVNYLQTSKESINLTTENNAQNLGLVYNYKPNAKGLISQLSLTGQLESNETNLINQTNHINFKGLLELNPLSRLFTKFELSNNHKLANGQISLNYENISTVGLWTGINKDKVLFAPNLNVYLNFNNLTLSIHNKPYLERKSYFDFYQEIPYGILANNQTDFFLPANANIELSYFNWLNWSLGADYQYAIDAPIYRTEQTNEAIFYDSFWTTSYYAKVAYSKQHLNYYSKLQIIDYHNFACDFIPFTPNMRINNSLIYQNGKFDIGLNYIIEDGMTNDYNLDLATNHILNIHSKYRLKKWLTLWTELINLADKDYSSFNNDKIKNREFKAGVKVFF
jgi:hypothetical protein